MQRRVIRAWILALDYTYDQVLQARCVTKMMSNISGTSAYEPTPLDDINSANVQIDRESNASFLYKSLRG